MQQARFSDDDDFARGRFLAKCHHFFRRTNFVCEHAHGVGAFRMRDHRRVWILLANFANAPGRELDVHVTSPLPQIHFAPSPLHHPRAQILIGHEKNISIVRRGAHNFVRVTARADHVRLRLHARAAIDVGDHIIIFVGVFLEKGRQFFWRARFRERAASIEIGQNHSLGRVNDLRGFGHEMNATEENHVRVGFLRFVAQA